VSTYELSNSAGILEAVTAQMGIRNEIGDEAAAMNGAAPRVIWQADDIVDEPIVRQPADGHAFEVEAQRWIVFLRAQSFTAAELLRRQFKGALVGLFSADGYAVRFKGAKPTGDRVGCEDFTWKLALELRVPVYDKLWTHSTLPNLVQQSGTVTADGTTTEPAP
jgi:hypothetical protein